MPRARWAHLRVFKVSSNDDDEGLAWATIAVRVLPPRESFSNRVSFESRKFTYEPFLERALMQLARAKRDLRKTKRRKVNGQDEVMQGKRHLFSATSLTMYVACYPTLLSQNSFFVLLPPFPPSNVYAHVFTG